MYRNKSSSDTPPPGPSNLINDFQSFCSSPQFTAALKESPLASSFTQQLVPSPTSVSSVPQSDYTTNIQCLASQLSKPFHDTALIFPDTNSTWELCHLDSRLPGYLDPTHFQYWTASPSPATPLSDSQLADQLLYSFRAQYPWCIFLKGTQSSDPTYGTHLSLLDTTSPPSPLPSISEFLENPV